MHAQPRACAGTRAGGWPGEITGGAPAVLASFIDLGRGHGDDGGALAAAFIWGLAGAEQLAGSQLCANGRSALLPAEKCIVYPGRSAEEKRYGAFFAA